MRNLKRVLSLALASAMIIGMMVMGAGAATTDYTDAKSITNKQAVDVMSAIGVLQGTDGKFDPTGVLTREQAAKVITYMMIGKKDADALSTSKAPFTDVKADRWSAGSIAYCVSNGVLAGMGDGTFRPEDKVTGVQFAKMLLVALGYNAATENYVGNDYAMNITKQASAIKLTNGMTNGLNSSLTREDAAQLALNTLEASLVEYQGGTTVILPDGTKMVNGGVRQYQKDNANQNIAFMSTYFPNLKTFAGDVDAFGRPTMAWKNGTTNIGSYAKTPEFTYTATTKESTVKNDLNSYFKNTAALKPVLNGVDQAQIAAGTMTAKNVSDLTGNGRVVEIYTDTAGNNNIIENIVVVDTVLAQIASINTTANVVSLSVKSLGGGTITVKKDATGYNELSAMAKDDYVLVTVNKKDAPNTVASVIGVPETMDGTLSTIGKDSKYTIEGTSYELSKTNNITANPGTTYTWFMDKHGFLIGATEIKGAAAKNAYVLNVEASGSAYQGNRVYSAQLLMEDGTQAWVSVTTVDKKSVSDANNNTGLFSGVGLKSRFVSYSEKTDGTYSLNIVDNAKGSIGNLALDAANPQSYVIASGAVITKNTVSFLKDDGTNVTANLMGTNKTVFLVKTGDTYKSYVGITNIPDFTLKSAGTVLVGKDSMAASMVVIEATSTTSDLVYILDKTYTKGDDKGTTTYTYDAIIKGELKTITTTVCDDMASAQLNTGLYTITSYNGTYASQLTKTSTILPAPGDVFVGTAGDVKVSNGIITVPGVAVSKVLAEDCTFFAVDKDSKATAIGASDVAYYANGTAAGDNVSKGVTLIANDKGFITSVIINYDVKA